MEPHLLVLHRRPLDAGVAPHLVVLCRLEDRVGRALIPGPEDAFWEILLKILLDPTSLFLVLARHRTP